MKMYDRNGAPLGEVEMVIHPPRTEVTLDEIIGGGE